ncbi:Transcriptional regulator, GntR family [Mucinivorans hirudinis]|uniref:Transcriptional regulator, GntR family n=1 Tax=Mucinivorans hirudinis TaxID=1433126 RepID=A0A060RB25_9BACT|nr:Transcriptional regulator, GntR family [Mucinivorans hirudinis]
MDFKDNRPIYLQIAALVCARIVEGEWQERIPSVRDLGSELGVNPNTCMRSYEYLTREDIIVIKRGIGYFVAEGAREKIVAMQRREFIEDTLPDIFAQMRSLGITIEELIKFYHVS